MTGEAGRQSAHPLSFRGNTPGRGRRPLVLHVAYGRNLRADRLRERVSRNLSLILVTDCYG